ncbi:MAG: hypothetical protein WC782_01860 [Methylococcaceae bacterium]|jgi:hypothetical protein
MSYQENTTKAVSLIKNKLEDLVAAALSLKEKDPKIFYGAIAGIVLLLLII